MQLWINRIADKIGQKSAENRAVGPLVAIQSLGHSGQLITKFQIKVLIFTAINKHTGETNKNEKSSSHEIAFTLQRRVSDFRRGN